LTYRVSFAINGGSYQFLSNSASTSLTAQALTPGNTYQFKVQAENAHGLSAYSESISVLAAYYPEPPQDIATANALHQVEVTWSEAIANGLPITAYELYFVAKDGQTYPLGTNECDGTSAIIIQERICHINLSTLTSSPFNLEQGDSVFA
jgi:hypothetical protein